MPLLPVPDRSRRVLLARGLYAETATKDAMRGVPRRDTGLAGRARSAGLVPGAQAGKSARRG